MTDDAIFYLIDAHRATSGEINDVIIFARAIEHCTLTKQKAKWYYEGVEAGLRQALAESTRREWLGLTDEELYCNDVRSQEELDYGRLVEARLKEKNI